MNWLCYKEKFEDTKWVMRSHNLIKDKGQKGKQLLTKYYTLKCTEN